MLQLIFIYTYHFEYSPIKRLHADLYPDDSARVRSQYYAWAHVLLSPASRIQCQAIVAAYRLVVQFETNSCKRQACWLVVPGARFSKVPKTFPTRKAICEATNRLFWKADLLSCFQGNKKIKRKVAVKFDNLNPLRSWDRRRIVAPENGT